MTTELQQAGLAALDFVRSGALPDQKIMSRWRRPYPGKLPGLDGGSGNLGAIAHLLGYMQGFETSRAYWTARLKDCLVNGLEAGEQLSGYGDPGETLLAWTAMQRGDGELYSLAAASRERVALLHCLCGRLVGRDLQLLAPGMRFEASVLSGARDTEAAALAHLLGTGGNDLKVREEVGRTWAGGLFLQAIREAEGVEKVLDRVRAGCLALLALKTGANIDVTDQLARVRLACPMTVEIYGTTEFFAYLRPGNTHPQDPARAGGGVVRGLPRDPWPFDDEDAPEGGWNVSVERGAGRITVRWSRGRIDKGTVIGLGAALRTLTFGPDGVEGLPASDPLADLPPLRDAKQGRRPTPPPPPPPPEENPTEDGAVPRPAKDPDLRKVQEALETIRDSHPVQDERRWAHRSLRKLNLSGAWGWTEG